MRLSVRVYAGEYDRFAPGALADHIGRVLPLRIGEVAYAATVVQVEPAPNGGMTLVLELPDSDLRFEALAQPLTVSQ